MLRILLSGCNGQMGKVITQLVSDNDNMEIVAGIDISGNAESAGFPIYDDPFKFDGEADVLIDFSNPASLSVCLITVLIGNYQQYLLQQAILTNR